MPLYDGFFDAAKIGENADGTPQYDREYSSGDFTEYFGQIIGSGVSVNENADSFLGVFEGDSFYLRPGYLFISGYWLKNAPGASDNVATYKGYQVILPSGTGKTAVVAHLNTGQKIVEIETQAAAETYSPGTLVLCIVDLAAKTVEDTRYNTAICGVIDSYGDISTKAAYAKNYIDTEISQKFAEIDAAIGKKSDGLDAAIANVNGEIDKISTPPIGAIKFSASPNVGEEWLECDGSFISSEQYPELVELLKEIPSTSFQQETLSTYYAALSRYWDTATIWNNYVWFIEQSSQNLLFLYGWSLSDFSLKKIQVSGYDTYKNPNLSIVEVDGHTMLYIFFYAESFATKMTYDTSGNISDIKTVCAGTYYYFKDFSLSAETVTLTKVYKEFEVFPEIGTTAFPYPSKCKYSSTYPGISNTIKTSPDVSWEINSPKVKVFDGNAYVLYDARIWSTKPLGVNQTSSAGAFFAIMQLGVNGELNLNFIPLDTSIFYLSNSENANPPERLKNLYTITGEFESSDKGWLIYYVLQTPKILYHLKGTNFTELGRANSVTAEWYYGVKSPLAMSNEYVVIDIQKTSDNRICVLGIKLNNMQSFKVYLNPYNASSYYFSENWNIFYLNSIGFWVILTDKFLYATSDISDTTLYNGFDISKSFTKIANSRSFYAFCDQEKTIYCIWADNNYNIYLGKIEFPENFDPIGGTFLPKISINYIPAYIKANEKGEETT